MITLTGPPKADLLAQYRALRLTGETRHRARKETKRSARSLLKELHEQHKEKAWTALSRK